MRRRASPALRVTLPTITLPHTTTITTGHTSTAAAGHTPVRAGRGDLVMAAGAVQRMGQAVPLQYLPHLQATLTPHTCKGAVTGVRCMWQREKRERQNWKRERHHLSLFLLQGQCQPPLLPVRLCHHQSCHQRHQLPQHQTQHPSPLPMILLPHSCCLLVTLCQQVLQAMLQQAITAPLHLRRLPMDSLDQPGQQHWSQGNNNRPHLLLGLGMHLVCHLSQRNP
jgi:hypothetical protein